MLTWLSVGVASWLALFLALGVWCLRRFNEYMDARARVWEGSDRPSPALDALRRSSYRRGVVAAVGNVLGFVVVMNIAARLQLLAPLEIALPTTGPAADWLAQRLLPLVVLFFIYACWAWGLRTALRAGPDWRWRSGSFIEIPRRIFIAMSLLTLLVVGPVMLVVFLVTA